MPTQLGPFRLLELAGSGGMGEVWRAEHAASGLPTAVKRITAEHARDPFFQAGFRREARAVARLDHPGVVRVYDTGVDGDGAPWLAMEWAAGGSLADAAAPGGWHEVSELLDCLLQALAHVHARGVLHRDLKPANVLSVTDGPGARGWRLADFGISRLAEQASSHADSAGTPRYMAPEQVRGDGRTQGPETDLYALGCMTWELVTGAPPFDGPRQELMRAHVSRPLPVFEPRFDVPRHLDRWLGTLLQKQPEARFTVAADARFALRGLGPAIERPAARTAPAAAHTPAIAHTWITEPPAGITTDATWTDSATAPRAQAHGAEHAVAPPAATAPWTPRRPPDPPPALRPIGTGLALLGLRPCAAGGTRRAA